LANKFFLLLALSLIIHTSKAQDTQVSPIPDKGYTTNPYATQSANNQSSASGMERKWYFGGFLSFAFWNEGTDLLISPKAYYKFSPMFMLGFGITYIYSDGEYRVTYEDSTHQIFDYHANSIGGSFAIIFRPINFLQLSAEYEPLHTTWQGEDRESIYWYTGLFLGVSYVTGNFAFGLRYNVLYNTSTSPYASALTPVVGFYF
jgi:hypothetical protein